MKKYDTHVHSCYSFVGNPNMNLQNISEKGAELGLEAVAITDHLIEPQDVLRAGMRRDDIFAFRTRFPKTQILYGVEVCELRADGATLLDAPGAGRYDVVIGGVHDAFVEAGSSLAEVAADQHKHQLMMMENPLIDILVHPYWLDKGQFEKLQLEWPQDLSFVPKEYVVELARASKATGTYIEISSMSGLCNKDVSERFRESYTEFYRILLNEGALFAVGSDAHELSEMDTVKTAFNLVEELAIPEDRMWKPKVVGATRL